jgi:AcrR family transcriptional regulator
MPSNLSVHPSTSDAVLDVAERLFAERGIDGVSLREIGKVAGSRNTGVAHYYFGDKQRLVDAIIARRSPSLHARRAHLLAEATSEVGDILVGPEVLVRVIMRPLAEALEMGDYFVGFLARIATESPTSIDIAQLDQGPAQSFLAASRLLARALPGLTRRRFQVRLDLLVQLMVTAIASRQRAERSGVVTLASRNMFLLGLLNAGVGIMLAPSGSGDGDPRIDPVPAAPTLKSSSTPLPR